METFDEFVDSFAKERARCAKSAKPGDALLLIRDTDEGVPNPEDLDEQYPVPQFIPTTLEEGLEVNDTPPISFLVFDTPKNRARVRNYLKALFAWNPEADPNDYVAVMDGCLE